MSALALHNIPQAALCFLSNSATPAAMGVAAASNQNSASANGAVAKSADRQSSQRRWQQIGRAHV